MSEQGSLAQPLPGFEAWVRSAATELRQTVPVVHLAESTPGSFGEAVALLTAPDMLYPDDDGDPAFCNFEGPSEFDHYLRLLMIGLYMTYYKGLSESLSDYPPAKTDLMFFATMEQPLYDPTKHVVRTNAVLIGENKDTLLFSEAGAQLEDYCATNLEDLRRIYELVGSAGQRV